MPLPTGTPAPAFRLRRDDGTEVQLAELTGDTGALLAFFKTTCPTCATAFPVYGRLAAEYGDAVPVVAIAQDPGGVARSWLDTQGFGGPVLDDAATGYAVSRAFAITVVPTLVFVEPDGTVGDATQAWDRDVTNAWAAQLAQRSGRPAVVVSTPADGRPPFRPG